MNVELRFLRKICVRVVDGTDALQLINDTKVAFFAIYELLINERSLIELAILNINHGGKMK